MKPEKMVDVFEKFPIEVLHRLNNAILQTGKVIRIGEYGFYEGDSYVKDKEKIVQREVDIRRAIGLAIWKKEEGA